MKLSIQILKYDNFSFTKLKQNYQKTQNKIFKCIQYKYYQIFRLKQNNTYILPTLIVLNRFGTLCIGNIVCLFGLFIPQASLASICNYTILFKKNIFRCTFHKSCDYTSIFETSTTVITMYSVQNFFSSQKTQLVIVFT